MSKKFYDSLSGRNKKQGKNFSSKKSQKKASQTARISGRGLGRTTRPNQKSSAETKEKTQTPGTKVFKNVSKPEKQTAVIPPARTKKAGKNFHTTGSQQRASDTARVWGRGLDRNTRKTPSGTKKYTDFTTSNGNLPLTNTQRKAVAASVGQQLAAENSKYRKTKKNWENVRLNKKDISAYRKDLAQQKEALEKTKKYYNDLTGINDLKKKKQALNDAKLKLAQAYTRGEDTTDLVKDALRAERELDEAEHPVYLREDGEKRDSKAEKALRDKTKETKSDYNKKKWRYDSMTANNFSAARAGDRPLQADLDKVDKAKAAMDKAQAKYDKADIAYQDYEYKGKLYDDTFSGEFAANYRASDLHQKAALAYTNYIRHMDDPGSESLKEKADDLNAIAESIAQANAGTMGDKSTVARDLFANAQASYLPQLKGQFKDMAAGAVYGGLTGAAIGTAAPGVGTAAGAATGIKAGIAAGSAKYAYDTTMGMVFKSLTDLGLDEDTASKAAKDEALVSSALEMADTIGDLAALGGGKFIDVIAKEGVKGIVRRTGSKEAGIIAAKFLKGLGKYGISVGQEGAEEGAQEMISAGNEQRAHEQVQTVQNISNSVQARAGGEHSLYRQNNDPLASETSLSEQIARNKEIYEKARKDGDWALMQAANDANNRIRFRLGQNLEAATGDIASMYEVKSKDPNLKALGNPYDAPSTSGLSAAQGGIPELMNETFNPKNDNSVVNKLMTGDEETQKRVAEAAITGMKTAVVSNGATMTLSGVANYNLTKAQYEGVARSLAKNGSGAQSEMEKAAQLANYSSSVAAVARGLRGKNAASASDALIGQIAIENQRAINDLLVEIGNSDAPQAKKMAQALNQKQAAGGNITAADLASLQTMYTQELVRAGENTGESALNRDNQVESPVKEGAVPPESENTVNSPRKTGDETVGGTALNIEDTVEIQTSNGKTQTVNTSFQNPETGLSAPVEQAANIARSVNPDAKVVSGIESMYVSAPQGKVSARVAAQRAGILQKVFQGKAVSEQEIQSLNLQSPVTRHVLNEYTGSNLSAESKNSEVRAVIQQAHELYDTKVLADQAEADAQAETARQQAEIRKGMNAYADQYEEEARRFLRESISDFDSEGNLEKTFDEFTADYIKENPEAAEEDIQTAYGQYLENNFRMDFQNGNFTYKQFFDFVTSPDRKGNVLSPEVADALWQRWKADYTDQGRVVPIDLPIESEGTIHSRASYQNIYDNQKQGMTAEEARQTELERLASEAGEKARRAEIEHTAEYLADVTKRFGIEEVKVDYDMPADMNGDIQWTQDGKAVVRINGNANIRINGKAAYGERATVWIFTHELFHQGSRANENLTESFLTALQEMQRDGLLTRELSHKVADMDGVQEASTKKYQTYEREVKGNDGSAVDAAYVREEMAADWMADLMNSSDMLAKMAGKRPGILSRLSDRFTYALLDILGQKQYERQQTYLGNMQRQLMDALAEAGKNQNDTARSMGFDGMMGPETLVKEPTGIDTLVNESAEAQGVSPNRVENQATIENQTTVETQAPVEDQASVSTQNNARASLPYEVNRKLEEMYGENDELKGKNRNLAQQLNHARRNLKRTTEPTANERSTAREARSLTKKYRSTADLKDVRKALGILFTEARKTDMRTADDLVFAQFYHKIDALAQKILSESSVVDVKDEASYNSLKARLKDVGAIYVDPKYRPEFEQFGGFNKFRQSVMGSMRLSSEEGIPVDVLYEDLVQEVPGYFDPQNHPADQLAKIRDVLNQLKPEERPLSKEEQREQHRALVEDILTGIYKRLEEAPATKMDRALEAQKKTNDKKLDSEKRKHAKSLERAELDKWKLADEYEQELKDERTAAEKKLSARDATWQSRLMRERSKDRMRSAMDREAQRMANDRRIAEIRRSKWDAIKKQAEEFARRRADERIQNRRDAQNARETIHEKDRLDNLKNAKAKTPHDKLSQGQADKLREAFKTPPEKTGKLQKAKDALKSGYNAFYRNFVSATKELEDFSKLQTAGIKTDNMVNLMMGQTATVDALYQKGFVRRDGTVDKEAGSMKEVFLCWDPKGKCDQEAQAMLHNYMLLMHSVDRMSFEERAETALTEFEDQNIWITTLNPEEEAAIAAARPGEELERLANGLPENAQDLVKNHLKLLRDCVEAKNKPVFESKEKGSALSAADSRDRADEMLADNPWLKEKADKIYAWWDGFMREWAVGTSITQEDYERIREIYPHYVPTFRVDKKNAASAVFIGTKDASVGQAVKSAKGGFSEIVPIEDSFADMAKRLISLNRSNELLHGIIASAREDRDGTLDGYAVFDDTTDTDVAALNQALLDMTVLNGDSREAVDPKKMLEEMGDGTYRVTCWENGKQFSAFVSREMFKAIGYTLGNQPLGEGLTRLSKIGSVLTNPMKTAITGINPMFALRNISRDIPTAIINGSSGVFGLEHMVWATKAVKEIMTNGEHWQTYQALGGNHAQYYNNEKGFSTSVGASGTSKNPFVMAAKGAAAVRDKMGAFNETTEAMNRFGEYLATIDRMGDTYEGRLQGMKNAAEITVDFSRKGYYGGLLNSWIPYWNPAVQGIDKVFRSVGLEFSEKISKEERLHKVLRSLPRIAITTAVPELVLYAVMKSQDDYDDWKELSDRTKDTYYCIPIPGEHKYLKIPKNREWGAVIGDPLMRLLEWADGDFKDESPFANWVEDALKTNFLPPMIISYDADTRKWESDIIGLGTALELQANRDFANRRIVSADLEEGSLENQYDENTSWLAKQLGGLLHFSPQQADYILGSYFGDFAKIVQTATSRHMDWSKSGVGNSLRESLLSPWIGYSTVSNQMVSDYYDLMDDLSTAATDEANGRVEGTAATDAQKAIQKLYGDRIKELNTKAREAESQKERLEAKEDLVKVIGEAYAYYGDIASGKIQDPLTDAKYHDYDPAVRDMLSDLKDFEDYKFKPSGPSENSKDKRISDPANDSKKFTLTGDQWAEYIDTYRRVYNATMAELVQSEAYQNAKTLEEKAALAEKARDSVSGKAKEQTAAALKQQGVMSSIDVEKWKKKNSSYQASVQDELIRLNNAEGKKYNVDPDSRDSVKAVTLNGTGTEFVLDDAARDQYEKIYNDMLDSAYNSVISGSKYRNANDDGKVSLLQEARKRVRSKAKTSMIKWLRTNGYAVTPKAN